MPRLNVRKTYKLYINGEFPRTESGRFYAVKSEEGELLANACRGSRKDLRNAGQGATASEARKELDRVIDRWVYYAGWSDKYPQVVSSVNLVAGPYYNFTVPEPTGVVGIVSPEEPALLGLVSRLAPAIVGGNTAVVLTSESQPLPAITLGEVFENS